MGFLNTIFATINTLCIDNPITVKPVHYYNDEHIKIITKLYNEFDFSKLQSYNHNVLKLNTLNEIFNPMSMNEVYFYTYLLTNYVGNWDNNITQ